MCYENSTECAAHLNIVWLLSLPRSRQSSLSLLTWKWFIVFSQIHRDNSASNYTVYSSSWSLGDRSPHRWWRIWRGNWLIDDFNLYEDIKVINDWKVWRETEEIKKDKNQRVSIRESLQIFIICLDMWATSISNSSI